MSITSVKLHSPLGVRALFSSYKPDGRPWLICGMGPTFSHRADFNLSKYNILGINRVVRHIPVELCSIIDYYILDLVDKDILRQANYLVMPYQPHFGYKPGHLNNIFNLAMYRGNLREINQAGKLLAYNLCTTPQQFGKTPRVSAHYFSAEAAFSILAHLGIKHVDLLGVDGGHKRAEEFKDHGPTDPRGFDIQWRGIDSTCKKFGMTYKKLKELT